MTNRYLREARLGDVTEGKPLMGVRQSARKDGDPLPYITPALVRGSQPVLSNHGSESTFGDVKERLVQRDDLLLIGRGVERLDRVPNTIVAFDGVAAFSESLLRLRPLPDRIYPGYLQLYLASRRGAATLLSVTSGTTRVSPRRMGGMVQPKSATRCRPASDGESLRR